MVGVLRTVVVVVSMGSPLATVVGTARTNTNGRTMALDAAGSMAYVLTTSGLSALPIDTTTTTVRNTPTIDRNGVVNLGSYQAAFAPGTLFGILGQNLGNQQTPSATPWPALLGSTCVTLGNNPVPLSMSSPGQVNGQIPPTLAAGRYALVVRSVDKQLASASTNVTVAKYAPAVFVSKGQAAVMHQDGSFVTRDNPARRDERLTIYATGLGATQGGKVTAGGPSPSNPLAVTGKVQVFFGDPRYSQAEVIVEWSGLAPGQVGVYQINVRVPGAHISGSAVPVTLRIGGVSSPSTGSGVPTVAVN